MPPPPNWNRTKLSIEQVRMILRVYWTDRYHRLAHGLTRSTLGIRPRLAKQFGVSVEVIKKIVGIKHNQYGRKRRARFRTIALKAIQRSVQTRLRQRYGDDYVRTGKGDHDKRCRRSKAAAARPQQAAASDGRL